jgi:hypothetical protein
MSTPNPFLTFAEDLLVFRQLTTPEDRAEFTRLMKRAYAQGLSACAFVKQSPERHVSAPIRRCCEAALTPTSDPPTRQAPATGCGTLDNGTLPAATDG